MATNQTFGEKMESSNNFKSKLNFKTFTAVLEKEKKGGEQDKHYIFHGMKALIFSLYLSSTISWDLDAKTTL